MANIGTVEGEILLRDAFSAPLAKAQAQLQQFATQLNALGTHTQTAGNRAKTAASSFDKFGSHIRNTLLHVGTAVVAFKAIGAAIDSVSNRVEFVRTLTQIRNVTSTTTEELHRFVGGMDEMVRATGRGPQELAKGFYVVASVMDDAATATEVLGQSAQLAAIGLGETNSIARALSASINAYGKENLSASQAANQLLVAVKRGGAEASEMAGVFGRVVGLANEMGISFAEVAASIATFTRLGVGADEAVTALRGTMNALVRPTEQARKDVNLLAPAFGRATMSIADLRQEIKDRGLADVLVTVTKAFGGNIDALGELFPNVRALAGILGNAGSQAETYKDILREVETNTTAVNAAMENTRKSASFRWDVLTGQFESLSLALGEALLPGFEALRDALVSISKEDLQSFGNSVTTLFEQLAVIVKLLLSRLDELKAILIALVAIKLGTAISTWVVGLTSAASAATTATTATTAFAASLRLLVPIVSIAVAALLYLSDKAKEYSRNALIEIDNIVTQAAAAGRALEIVRNQGRGATQGGYLEQLSAAEEKTNRLAQVTKEIGELEARQEIRRTGQNNIRLKQLRAEEEALSGEIKLHKDAANTIVQTSVVTGRWAESVNTLEYEWDSFWGTWVKKKETGVSGLGELSDAQKTFANRIDETIEKLVAQHDAAKANLDLALATQRARLSGGGDEIEVRIAQQKEIQLRVTQAINSLETHKNKLSADQLGFITRIVTKTVQLENEAAAVVDLTRELVKLSKQAAERFSEFAEKVRDIVTAQKQAGGDQMSNSIWFTGPFQITQLEKQLDLADEVVTAWMRGGEVAARIVLVQQEALDATAGQVKLTYEQAAAIVRLQVEQEKLNYLLGKIDEVSIPAWERYYDAAFSAIDGVVDVFGDALTQMLQEGEVSWDSLWEGLKATAIDIFVDLMKQILKQWLYTQAAMAATDYASGSGGMGGGTGGGGGWMNMLGGLFGMGGGGGGTGALAGHEGAHVGQSASGGSGGALSGAAGAFAIVAVIYALAKWASDAGTAMEKFSLGASGGNFQIGRLTARTEAKGQVALYMAEQVVGYLNSLLDNLGASVVKAGEIAVGRKGRGKDAKHFVDYVDAAGNKITKFFDDIEEAISFGAVVALKASDLRGLSPEIATAIKNSMAQSIEQMEADIDVGQRVLAARLGETGAQIAEIFRNAARDIEAAQRLGLATDDLVRARDREVEAIRNSMLGIDDSVSLFLESLRSFNDGITEAAANQRAVIEAQIAELERQMATYRSRSGGGPGGTGAGGGEITSGAGGGGAGRGAMIDFSDMDPVLADLQRQIDEYLEQLDRIPQALSEQELSMAIFDQLYRYLEGSRKYEAQRVAYARLKVEIEFELIKQQLILLNKWIEFEQMWNDARNAATREAGRPRRVGGGAGGSEAADRRRQQEDLRREVGGFGLSDIAARIREINFWLVDFSQRIKEAGFSTAETSRLLALAAEEAVRRQNQIKQDVAAQFQAFLGIGQDPFSQLRQRHEDLGKQIDAAGYGATRAARMHARLNAALESQLVVLSQQEFVSLGDNLMSFLEKYYGEVAGFEDVRLAMEELRFHLELEAMRARFELLKAEGRLAEELINKLGGIFKFIDTNPPDFNRIIRRNQPEPPINRLSDAADDAARAIEELARRFASAKERIADFITEMAGGKHGVVTSRQAFEFQQQRFREIFALAKTGEINALETIPDAGRDLLEALAKFSPALLAVEFPKIQTDMMGLLNLTTARDQNVFVDERFQKRHTEQLAVQQAGFSSLTSIGQTQIAQQADIVTRLDQMVASQNRLSERLSLLEAQQSTLKRSAGGGG